MCNSGALGAYNQITLDFKESLDGYYYQAGYGDYNNSILSSNLRTVSGTTANQPASAYCRTFGGVTGGQFYEMGVGGVPCWWDSSGGGPNLVDYGSPKETGLFWDVNHDLNDYDTFAGYYLEGIYKQGCVWNSSYLTGPKFPTITGYNGSECRCINSSDDVAGQVFGSSSSPPAFWYYTGGTPPWTLVVPSGWPSGRDGYIVGITKRDSNGNVYAVGYELPTLIDPNSGQPFVYNYSSGAIRFLGTQYGPPTQISNEDYDVNDPIVSFSGDSNTTGLAYIWRGSPDPNSAFTGAFDDVWAYFDPEVPQPSDYALVITGLNSSYWFGGHFPDTRRSNLSPWMVDDNSAWAFGDQTGVLYSVTTGSLVTGASLSDLESVNGRFAQVEGFSGTGPQIVVEADYTVPSDATYIAFRATDELDLNAMNNYDIQFYSSSRGWVTQTIPRSLCPTYWQTQTAQVQIKGVGGYPEYVNGGVFKAQIRINVTGSTSVLHWNADIDQLTFLYK